MPAYATLDDMLARFQESELVQLTDEAGAGTIDQDKVDQAIVAASGTIDAYLAGAYKLPLATVHPTLVDLACDMARFRLCRGNPTEGVERAHTAAMKTLREIAAGTIKIDSGVEEHVERPGAVLIEGADRIFSRDRMKGF